MSKKITFLLICCLFAVTTACTSTETNNANSVKNANNANIPPEFSASPLPVNNSAIPGITDTNSANGNQLPKGATPTPGIPDEKTRNEQMKNISGNSKTVQKPSNTKSNANSDTMDKSRTDKKP